MKYTFYTVKGKQGNIDFYQTHLKYGEIDTLAAITGDAKSDRILPSDSPYKLQERSIDNIARKLQQGMYCSVLTLAIVPANMKPLELDTDYKLERSEVQFIDRLTINTSFSLVALDGRHQIAAIRKVLAGNPELANQKAATVLVPFTGIEQTTRLFNDLRQSTRH